MTTIQSNAIAAARTAAQAVAGVSVVYRRGTDEVTIQVLPAATSAEVESEAGIFRGSPITDWLIKAADLVIDSAVVLPQTGDQIDIVRGSTLLTYEVRSPGGAEPEYRDSDRGGEYLRVHSRLLRRGAAP